MRVIPSAARRPASRTLGRVAIWIAVVTVVVPFVVYAFPAVVGGSTSHVVVSDSMSPAITVGDVVVVDAVDPATLRAGDVVTFRDSTADGRLTTHRVIDVVDLDGELAVRTKGDANDVVDPEPVTSDRILGEVALVIPYLGFVVRFVNTTVGFLALVVVPLGALVATEIGDVVSSCRPSSAPTDGRGTGEDRTVEFTVAGDSGPDEPTGDSVDGAGGDATSTPVYTVTRTDLRLTLVVLATFSGYSAWVAYANLTTLSAFVAFASTSVTLLVAALVLAGGSGREDAPGSGHGGADEP